ncbi:hypothetical protein [Anaeromyxobacter oryzisoli]|uniref:hypothetical protein n=1 Tax=Anaeromyxobacter oryzisoli TaxID=2925408 RepID=UPI001F5887BD|nr:hypothetical protein [Anaeromyxobacter sp. SG63]
MSDRLTELEERTAVQGERLRRLEERLAALEAAAAGAPARQRGRARARPAPTGADAAMMRSDLAAAASSASLVGRTLLVLAGAFVLRALADAGALPAGLAVLLGLAYAATWIALADRAGRAGARASAAFHGAAAAIIGVPLVVEATSRFRLLPPALAAVLLAAFTGAALAVAVRRRLLALAWIVSLGGVAGATALAAVAGRLAAPAPALVLVALGVATLWIGYVVDWRALRGPIAIAADVAVGALALRATGGAAAERPVVALGVQGVLVTAYLGSIAARTLLLGRRVVPFEVVQGVAALAIGLGGAALVVHRTGTGAAALGTACLALGAAGYAVAFAFVERRPHRVNFHFYASLALVLVACGAALLLPARALALASATLAVAAAAIARRSGRLSLAGHATAYALIGAGASGLLSRAGEAILASPGRPAPASPPPALVVPAASAAAWLCAPVPRSRTVERLPQLALVAAVAVTAAAGVAIGGAVPILAGVPGRGAAAGAVAAVRTAILVGVALAAAWVGRRASWLEAGWLAPPALGAIGLKILLEDVPRGRPATLVAAFACYGAALILVPRLRRRAHARVASPA